MDKPVFNGSTLIAWGHDPYYKTEFESALRDGKIFLQDGVHFDNIKDMLENSKPKPMKASKAFDYMPRDELIIIAEALDSLFIGNEDLEKKRAKMLKQAKHILRARHGLGQ